MGLLAQVLREALCWVLEQDTYPLLRMSVLIWIQTVWHSDSCSRKIFFEKVNFEKRADGKKNMKNYPACKELNTVWYFQIPGKKETVNSLHLGKFFMLFCRLLKFLKMKFFEKKNQKYQSECQTNWIRPNILSGLIWFQTVCKGYQQTTLGGKELNTL